MYNTYQYNYIKYTNYYNGISGIQSVWPIVIKSIAREITSDYMHVLYTNINLPKLDNYIKYIYFADSNDIPWIIIKCR